MRPLLVAAAVIAIACASAAAQTYRWVDKDGGVHYTQTPPPADAKNVQKKNLAGSVAESSSLPYASQQAARNFPVTLYTSPDCGEPCDQARAVLVSRTVPFREVSAVDTKSIDEMKKLSGKTQLPTLLVGSQAQSGFRKDIYENLLDLSGYPGSGPQLPLEALRKMEPGPKAAEAAPAEAAPAAPPAEEK